MAHVRQEQANVCIPISISQKTTDLHATSRVFCFTVGIYHQII